MTSDPTTAVPGLGLPCPARTGLPRQPPTTAILANSLRHGPTSNAGASVEGFSNASNILNVPERKLFAGSIDLAITLPVAHIDVEAVIGPLGVETRWLGLRRHHQQITRVAPSHTSLMSRR